jgi:hypothetical protein
MPSLEDVYDDEAEQEALAAILDPRYVGMLAATHAAVGSALAPFLGADAEAFRLDDAATRAILAESAERVVLITAATRDALREQLREGQRRGYSAFQIANGVPAEDYRGVDGLFRTTWRGRAETVARTELAHAQNVASLDRYAATGLVDEVEIVEHNDTDAPCAARNGTVVPLSEKPGLLHPNCQMGLIPRVRTDAPA